MIPSAGGRTWLRLVHEGHTVAAARLAVTRAARRRGLLGTDRVEGVVVLRTRSVHTVGMRYPIDVALCDTGGGVRRVLTLSPGRVSRPVRGARIAIEAPAGAFARWGIGAGDRLELVA